MATKVGQQALSRWGPRGLDVWSRYRPVIQPVADGLVWSFALLSAGLLRYGDSVPTHFWPRAAMIVGIAVGAQLAVGYATSLYRVRWQVGSFEEMAALGRSVISVTCILTIVTLLLSVHPLPVSAIVAAGAVSLVLDGSARSVWRLFHERSRRPADRAERAIVFGAGQGGVQLVNALLTDPDSSYLPVALLDDDPQKRHARLRHLKVSGTRSDLRYEATRVRADTVIIAIPSAESELIREVSGLAVAAGLTVRVLPQVSRFFRGAEVTAGDVRPVSEADLLGRRIVDTEIDSVAGYLTGRRVLVTGAGGSIGSELCRQIHRYAPSGLVK
jgi:FlaA1/EpsC-like NDP-sugar epimerase